MVNVYAKGILEACQNEPVRKERAFIEIALLLSGAAEKNPDMALGLSKILRSHVGEEKSLKDILDDGITTAVAAAFRNAQKNVCLFLAPTCDGTIADCGNRVKDPFGTHHHLVEGTACALDTLALKAHLSLEMRLKRAKGTPQPSQ